ncbi:signal peptidase I, partial [candidate division WOR-3 bacterium]|nr:signal peptidase I [candidate division WOR-3 bacterium]MBD3363673.1 signal peptidase I [candidate division WOR-3 bacterium]
MAKRRAKKPKQTNPPRGKQGSKGKKHKRSFGRRLWDFVRSWGTVIIIVLGIRAFGIESMVVPTGSMEYTILPGDFVIVNKFVYGFKAPFTNKNILGGRMPHKGDIIVFRYPRHPRWARPYDRYRTIFPREFPLLPIHWDTKEKTFHWFAPENWVKRCVGVPGDTVEITNKRLFVNSAPFDDYGKATYQEPVTFPRLVPRDEFQDRWMDLLVFLYEDSLYYADSSVYKSLPEFGSLSFEGDIRLYYDSLFTALFYSGNMPTDYFNHYLTSFYLHPAYQGASRTTSTPLH